MLVPELTPSELNAELKSGASLILVDVRESHELEISRLRNVVHIPMREIPIRFTELDRATPIVVVCRTGNRSGRVTAFLLEHGFSNVRNLSSGMNGWAETVDPTMARY